MKILQINKYPSFKGGTEVVLFDTIDLLRQEGHDVILFSTDEGQVVYNPTYVIHYPDKESSRLEKLSNLTNFFYNRKASQHLELILKTEKPDIAHIHLYLNGLSQSILPLLQSYNIPIVMTLHEYRQICPSYLLSDKNANVCEKCIDGNYFHCLFTRCSKGSFVNSAILTAEMYYRRLFYKTERYVDKFICVSDFVYNKYKQFNPDITEKSIIIRNPVSSFSDIDNIKGDYFLYVGRLSKEKGIETLIEAVAELPTVKLKIVGVGDLDLTNAPPNVEFLGLRTKNDINRLLKEAMFTIVPSEWNETFGLSCAESLAVGTPVIASDMGALPELVIDGKNGYLFQAKNREELKEMIKKAVTLSDQQYRSMSDYARESIRTFSKEMYIEQLLGLYKTLLKTNL